MSGHSKWAKVKHQKAGTDAVRGKVFTKLANAISVSVRQGGGTDPSSNFKLRLAIEKAREHNMPKEKIERAIVRGAGVGNEAAMEEIVYEGFGPGGIGILIEAATENKQRTVAAVKNVLDRRGGVLAATGAVMHMFSHVGAVGVPATTSLDSLLEAAIEAGALDIEEGRQEDTHTVYTQPTDLHSVKTQLTKKGFSVTGAELQYREHTAIPISDVAAERELVALLSALESLDDVQRVFTNAVFSKSALPE